MQVTISDEGKRTFTSMNIWSLLNQCMKCLEDIQYIQSVEPDLSVKLFDLIIKEVPLKYWKK